jgi:hypothetical protein
MVRNIMLQRMRISAFLFVGFFNALPTLALTFPFGREETESAGVGCIGGWMSEHGSTSYYSGDVEALNRQLRDLARKTLPSSRLITIVFHEGNLVVDDPEEERITSPQQPRRRISVDWLVGRHAHFDSVVSASGCREKIVTVHVWASEKICRNNVNVPEGVETHSTVDAAAKSGTSIPSAGTLVSFAAENGG